MISRKAARAILAYRAARDPLASYVPGPTQLRCLRSQARYRWIGGPNRGGKTAHVATELAMAALRRHPTRSVHSKNGLYLVLAPSREQLADPWGKKLLKESELKGKCFGFPMIPKHEIAKFYTVHGAGAPVPKELVLKNGNRIMFMVAGDSNVWERVAGKGMVLGIAIDETAGNEQLLNECIVRLLDANSDADVQREAGGGWILWGATEADVNIALIEYIQKCESPDFQEFEGFRVTADENPAISLDERNKISAILGEEQAKIRMAGTGSALGALAIYPMFNPLRHVIEGDYEIQDDDNIWIGYDPGTNYTGIVLSVISKAMPYTARIIRCWQPRRQTIDGDVIAIRDFLKGRAVECFVYDPAARKIEKTGTSVYGQLGEKLRLAKIQIRRGLAMGRNRHEDSIPVVRHYLDPDPKNPAAVPKILIHTTHDNGCRMLVSQMLQYRLRPNTDNTLGVENVYKENDHLVDALRYLVNERPMWVKRPENPALWSAESGGPPRPMSDTKVMTDAELQEADRGARSRIAARKRLSRWTSLGGATSRLPWAFFVAHLLTIVN